MAKYHVNTETGQSGICRADPSKPNSRGCRFKLSEDEHYPTKEAAAKAYEAKMEAEADSAHGKTRRLATEERLSRLEEGIIREDNGGLDFDILRHELDAVRDWKEDWTEDDRYNLKRVERLVALTSEDGWSEAKDQEAEQILAEMRPAVDRPYIRAPGNRIGRSTDDPSWNDYNARDKNLNGLAGNILRRKRMDQLSFEAVDEIDNPRLLGLGEAQEEALRKVNHSSWNVDRGTTTMGAVEPHFQEAISRVARGDEWHGLAESSDHRSLLSEKERIFASIHPEAEGGLHDSQLYLSAVFPVRELKEEMDRVGIEGVSVSSFDNTREQGNVYTVITPGGTRSFSVYEHRNTDSITINGKENWNGEELPYATESKYGFFAEFHPDDRKRAAQALTFYMMQAQQGALEPDEELAAKVSRRDWNAILDESVPGFKEWRQEKITDRYIAAQDESEEETLRRLDFEA